MSGKFFKLILLVIFIFVYPACSIAGDDDEFIPLAIGNYWVYSIEMYMGDTLAPIPPMTDTVEVKQKIDWGGHTWYSFSDPSEEGEIHYYRNAEDGHYQLTISPEFKEGKTALKTKFPLQLNDTWLDESDSLTITVDAINETVTVPAGKFEGCYCLKIKMSEEAEHKMWVKPGVGQVKMEFKAKQGEMDMRSVRELIEYHLK
ncbi:hypothetical protein HQ587_02620 [bacterium]|nr:hypothetical protein [bacterium]